MSADPPRQLRVSLQAGAEIARAAARWIADTRSTTVLPSGPSLSLTASGREFKQIHKTVGRYSRKTPPLEGCTDGSVYVQTAWK